jgi:hypothetical protein
MRVELAPETLCVVNVPETMDIEDNCGVNLPFSTICGRSVLGSILISVAV